MRILLHVSDSRESAHAARLTGEIARLLGGGVTMLCVSPSFDRRLRAFQQAEEALGAVRALERRVAAGLLERELPRLANAGRFDMAVLGRLGGLDAITGRLLIPPMIRHLETNTLLVRGKRASLSRVLACTSGAAERFPTVQAAVDLARAAKAQVNVLHVLSQMPLEEEGTTEIEQLLQAEHPAGETLARAREATAGVPGSVKLRVGLVVEEILQEIHDGSYDLVVIGAHGAHDKWLTQDISEYLVNHVPTTLLVVRRWPPPGGG